MGIFRFVWSRSGGLKLFLIMILAWGISCSSGNTVNPEGQICSSNFTCLAPGNSNYICCMETDPFTCTLPEDCVDPNCLDPVIFGDLSSFNSGENFADVEEWDVRVTCVNRNGTCLVDRRDDSTGVVQDQNDPSEALFQIADSSREEMIGDRYKGQVCGSSFTWEKEQPDDLLETGTWNLVTPEHMQQMSEVFDLSCPTQPIAKCFGEGVKFGSSPLPPSCSEYNPIFDNDLIQTVAGPSQAPVTWEEKFSCVDIDNNCLTNDDNNEFIAFNFTYNTSLTQLNDEVIQGEGIGDKSAGPLCERNYRWVSPPGSANPGEKGCSTFNTSGTAFNKRTAVLDAQGNIEYKCIGRGTRGVGSSPPNTLSCIELGSLAATVTDDFFKEECPPSPPSLPQN